MKKCRLSGISSQEKDEGNAEHRDASGPVQYVKSRNSGSHVDPFVSPLSVFRELTHPPPHGEKAGRPAPLA